jgi:ABC-type nitrate/sulfonate/bicarbonate transport system permease component
MSTEMSVQVNQGQRVSGRGKLGPRKRSRPGLARLRRSRRANLVLATQVAVVLAALALWQLLSGRVIQSFLVSDPVDVAKKLWDVLGTSQMHHDIAVTGQELIYGWAVGSAAGAVVGWGLGTVKFLGEAFEPIINAINGVPKIALAPLFLLWFGFGISSKVVLAAMIVFFIVFYNVARVMGASRWYVVRKVVLPSVAVPLFAALKAGVSLAMIGVIAGEYISAQDGVGYYTMTATQNFDPAGLFAAIVIIVAMVVIGYAIIGFFERRALAWQQK